MTAAEAPVVREAAQAESAEPKRQDRDAGVDDLANALGKTSI